MPILETLTDTKTVEEMVKDFLQDNSWKFGGVIARYVGAKTRHKESTCERIMRWMTAGTNGYEKTLEKQEVPNPLGKGRAVVQYKLLQEGQKTLF